MVSNVEMIQAHARAGRITTFESRYAVTEDSGLTAVINGGNADGNVYDIAPEVAKKLPNGTHVEVVFDTKNTADVTDDEPIKVIVLR